MSKVAAFLRPPAEDNHKGRLLHCTRCNDLVRVHDFPAGWIDEATYVCGECLRPAWVDIPSDKYDLLLHEATRRNTQKKGYDSSRYLAEDPHLLGLMGEWVFGRMVGMDVDLELRIAGDDGTDFAGQVDVKASTHLFDADLKEYLEPEKWAPLYALVVLDLASRRGRYAGYATLEKLQAAPRKDYGYGERLALSERELDHRVPRLVRP